MKRLIFLIFAVMLLFSCKSKVLSVYNFSASGNDYLNDLINKKAAINSMEDFKKWLKDISDLFINETKSTYLPIFLGELSQLEKNEDFKNYLYFFISDLYWELGDKDVSVYYMLKVDKIYYSIDFKEGPVGYFIARRIISCNVSNEVKIKMYEVLLNNYKDKCDIAVVLYEMSNIYKKMSDIKKAINVMNLLIEYSNKNDNTNPEININSIKNEIYFYNLKKDWVYRDIKILINNVKDAIQKKDYYRLSTYASKTNFYGKIFQKTQQTLTYNQIEIYKRWNRGIIFEENPSGFSSANEVFIKSDNWDFLNMNTWYFYFKKIDYPYDIDINGSWEWAGIFFGSPY
jgi:hypothetical protein